MVYGARRHDARQNGIPFEITRADIRALAADLCPVLGVELRYVPENGRVSAASPSVDRLMPELGYVEGNIIVMSFLANTLKSNGTIIDHAKVMAWLLAQPSADTADKHLARSILAEALAASG